MIVSAHTNRVPVIDGHTETLSIGLDERPSPSAIREALEGSAAGRRRSSLPCAPPQPIVCLDADDRPQPRLDVDPVTA